MAYCLPPDGPDQPDDAPGASLTYIPASAQQAPDALFHCPVCGQPYSPESAPAFPRPASATREPGERLVLRCAHCSTYSVGSLRIQEEEHSSLKDRA